MIKLVNVLPSAVRLVGVVVVAEIASFVDRSGREREAASVVILGFYWLMTATCWMSVAAEAL